MANQQEKPEFVLFFMNDCRFCKNFMAKLKQKPELYKKFNIVDINSVPYVPEEVDEVPCVYDGKLIHKGGDSFKWLNEKITEFLSPANDGTLPYSFLEGQDEQIFSNYSLLEQKNGSYGMGETTNNTDPTRMAKIADNSNKNRTLESLMASRSADMIIK